MTATRNDVCITVITRTDCILNAYLLATTLIEGEGATLQCRICRRAYRLHDGQPFDAPAVAAWQCPVCGGYHNLERE